MCQLKLTPFGIIPSHRKESNILVSIFHISLFYRNMSLRVQIHYQARLGLIKLREIRFATELMVCLSLRQVLMFIFYLIK